MRPTTRDACAHTPPLVPAEGPASDRERFRATMSTWANTCYYFATVTCRCGRTCCGRGQHCYVLLLPPCASLGSWAIAIDKIGPAFARQPCSFRAQVACACCRHGRPGSTLRRCSLFFRGTWTTCRSPPLLLWPAPGYQCSQAAVVECEEGRPCCCPCFRHQLLQLRAGRTSNRHMCRPAVLVPPRRHVNYCHRRRDS